MKEIKVAQVVGGALAGTVDQGHAVLAAIAPEVEAGRPVELDFAGVDVITCMFLASAVIELVKRVGSTRVKEFVKVKEDSLAPFQLEKVYGAMEDE